MLHQDQEVPQLTSTGETRDGPGRGLNANDRDINHGEIFRYSDYKPLPPPKTSIYKPVPPPKPKPFSRSNSQPPSMAESNYMNGNYMNAGQAGAGTEQDYSQTVNHYHSSRVAGIENGYASTMGTNYSPTTHTNGYASSRVNGHTAQNGHNGMMNGNGHNNGHPSLPNGHSNSNGHTNGNGYDDHDSNGVDSGQGSSLDRDYSSYNGHGQYASGARDSRYQAPNGQGQGVWQGGAGHSSQYYYNLPHRQQQQQAQTGNGNNGEAERGQEAGTNSSPRRRAPGDTLDLTNREYRGSAFELYKKPGYSIPSTYTGDVPR